MTESEYIAVYTLGQVRAAQGTLHGCFLSPEDPLQLHIDKARQHLIALDRGLTERISPVDEDPPPPG